MGAVTYIVETPEQREESLSIAARIAITAYEEKRMKNNLMKISEAAKYLNIVPKTLRLKLEKGTIPYATRGPDQVSEYELEQYKKRKK